MLEGIYIHLKRANEIGPVISIFFFHFSYLQVLISLQSTFHGQLIQNFNSTLFNLKIDFNMKTYVIFYIKGGVIIDIHIPFLMNKNTLEGYTDNY